MPKIRYAQQPAFCLPFNYSESSRICPLPGFHRTRLFQHADGYSYLLLELYQILKAVETAADLSPCLKPGVREARFWVRAPGAQREGEGERERGEGKRGGEGERGRGRRKKSSLFPSSLFPSSLFPSSLFPLPSSFFPLPSSFDEAQITRTLCYSLTWIFQGMGF